MLQEEGSFSLKVAELSVPCYRHNNRVRGCRNLSSSPIPLLLSCHFFSANEAKKHPATVVFQGLQKKGSFNICEGRRVAWALTSGREFEVIYSLCIYLFYSVSCTFAYKAKKVPANTVFQRFQQKVSFSVCKGEGDVWSLLSA